MVSTAAKTDPMVAIEVRMVFLRALGRAAVLPRTRVLPLGWSMVTALCLARWAAQIGPPALGARSA